MSDLGHVQQTNSLDYGLAWRCGCSICICWSFEVFTITYVHAHPPPPLPPPSLACQIVLALPLVGIIYAKSRVVGYCLYSEEKLLGTPGAFSLLDIHVGSIMVTTFDPSHDLSTTLGVFDDHSFQGPAFFLIKFYMGTLWVQMYNTVVALLFVEVSHLPILCPLFCLEFYPAILYAVYCFLKFLCLLVQWEPILWPS